MHDRHVLLVSEGRGRADQLADAIGLAIPCRVLAPDSLLPSSPPTCLVIGLGPGRTIVGFAERLHAQLARWRLDGAVPCLVLGQSARHLRVDLPLGDATLIRAPWTVSGVVRAVLSAVEAARARPGDVTVRASRATRLVATLFDDAASGRAPGTDAAEAGTEIVLEAISEIGIRAWLDLVWRHDIGVYQHSLSVAGYAAAFAAELGFGERDRRTLARAALLHDVGKALIPSDLLDRAGPLVPDEMDVMRTHACLGGDLLTRDGTFQAVVVDVARHHHERLDGSGYPDGLAGGAIGDLARLVAICDVHSALTERRVYRAPLPAGRARAMMARMAGQLDADLLRAYDPIFERADRDQVPA